MTTPTPYKDAFQQAIEDLSKAMETRETLELDVFNNDRRISMFREAALSLGGLCGKSIDEITTKNPELFPDMIDPDIGMTDAVRQALQSAPGTSLSPIHVRNRMEKAGFDMSGYKNVLASIHTILKRLKLKNEVLTRERDGKTVYKWNVLKK